MERCFVNKDLNPKTCRFVNKCKPDEERDVNFNCRKKSNASRGKISRTKVSRPRATLRKKKKANSYQMLLNELNRSKSPNLNLMRSNRSNKNVKMMTNMLNSKTYSHLNSNSNKSK
ncbi:hypothetical protein 162290223 [Organic Lake phycodnavirus 1]|jgi:hypothetical protein|nr:hypothetical protein 162290223 [Organic Lake phycodnavirus 1]